MRAPCIEFIVLVLLVNHIIMFDGFAAAYANPLETYIVHVESPLDNGKGDKSEMKSELEEYYLSFMPTSSRAGEEVAHILFSYVNVFIGFAAKLSEEDVKEMETKPGFIYAEKEEILSMDTTNSPHFMGLYQNTPGGFWEESDYGRGIIIGVLDSGINPDQASFGDAGMPIPPTTWTGKCEFSACNNKLIGARSLVGGVPLDATGHGSHVAGIAAGNFVNGSNVNGNGIGTAAGIAPRAHLAIYKVCHDNGSCPESAMTKGMDFAIGDGVNIISMSLGSTSRPFYRSSPAIGAFAAMERGIFVSCSAGNRGHGFGNLSNEAPWVLTVGASTTDRQITSAVMLGNNNFFEGQSGAAFSPFPTSPLIFPGLTSNNPNVGYCALFQTDIRGRIVVCRTGGSITRRQKGLNIRIAGGIAMILINQEDLGYSTRAYLDAIPTSHVSYADGLKIIAYLRAASSPTATLIFIGTVTGYPRAPMVAAFSSRGPNQASNGILKPDILGPGVDIISASRITGAWHMDSGTSMACPHLSGVAALLKRIHPDWSPAAIRSAIMTTANIQDHGNNPISNHFHNPANVFEMGSGHVNPSRANKPGLIYDISPEEYIPFLCGLGYTPMQVQIIVGRAVDCRIIIPQAQLNYPSFSIIFGQPTQTYTRTLTNVGMASSTYTASFISGGLQITVNPTTLRFTSLNQKISYQVTFRLPTNRGFTKESAHGGSLTNNDFVLYQGSITWTSSQFSARAPFAGLVYRNAALSNLETLSIAGSFGREEL